MREQFRGSCALVPNTTSQNEQASVLARAERIRCACSGAKTEAIRQIVVSCRVTVQGSNSRSGIRWRS